MIIDFHTHVYPDKIAQRTVNALQKFVDGTPYTDGTVDGLLHSMKEAGVGKCVILPVTTRSGQFESITKFAKHINDTYDNLISFGGIHPDDEDIPAKIRFLKDSGFKGIKIHPDYTETFIDDERYIRMIAEAKQAGLSVITHAGKDPAYDIIHCPPDRGINMLRKVNELVPGTKTFLIFAHLGGSLDIKEAEKYLVGQNCYIDISCSFNDIGTLSKTTDDDIVRVIKNHGADKILFATDSPWNGQKEYVKRFKTLKGLSDTEKEMILGKNAERILNL
ncbi:MAG: amidohydrolase [Ruminococcus sp.]|uniref:amidohydrolase family protein n=1 Tax=Ruminococcus sp. TaxID=41978 RepID=UPI0028734723|nr:amidohydrolase family protein [Ruminococcus sp.]MBQ3285968.1 amidohydrolase [Ruminococcus sp.]